LEALFSESDVVSLHVPLTPETRNLVNDRRLAMMKPTAFLINTSRGWVIDELALRKALDAGRLAGAALDVLSAEPPPPDHPLIGAPRCIVTPHIAWSTAGARRRLMGTVVENLAAFLGGRPINVVNP
jgi:glycerate dehydrogenase